MSWKPKYKLLSGWTIAPESFRTRREAVRHALAVANRYTVIVNFDVVKRKRLANASSLVR